MITLTTLRAVYGETSNDEDPEILVETMAVAADGTGAIDGRARHGDKASSLEGALLNLVRQEKRLKSGEDPVVSPADQIMDEGEEVNPGTPIPTTGFPQGNAPRQPPDEHSKAPDDKARAHDNQRASAVKEDQAIHSPKDVLDVPTEHSPATSPSVSRPLASLRPQVPVHVLTNLPLLPSSSSTTGRTQGQQTCEPKGPSPTARRCTGAGRRHPLHGSLTRAYRSYWSSPGHRAGILPDHSLLPL